MGQIHKRFANEQIGLLFGAYVHGHIKRIDVQEALAVGKSRFFELLREYRQAPETLSTSYARRRRELSTSEVSYLESLAAFIRTPDNRTINGDTVMSVAWPQKTGKGLGSPGK